jgi:Protein of unknown function (DUF1549)
MYHARSWMLGTAKGMSGALSQRPRHVGNVPHKHGAKVRSFAVLVCLLVWISGVSAICAGDSRPEPPGLGDPGKLLSISIETGRTSEGRVRLVGRDCGQQLLVTGQYDSGQLRDLTRSATYAVSPEGVVSVDATGYVSSIEDGQAAIRVTAAPGMDTSIRVEVTNIAHDLPINFPNQIVPVFTKHGCNGGGCHGKSGGQNGFALSLLGFEPSEDYEHLLKEGRGRRLFPAAPDRSLLLLKATGTLPHGGGQRIDGASPSYRLLRRWIEQGLPYGKPDDPTLARIEVLPEERLLGRNCQQQLVVVAQYTDGDASDVTRFTTLDSQDTEMAAVDVRGLVTTNKLTGSMAVMARFHGQVGVFRGTIPLGVSVDHLPAPKNFIDELVFAKLQALGLPASPPANDHTVLRRATLDIAGRLPMLEETERFLADPDPDKRGKWIERLLQSSDYAEYFANKWNAVLRNKRRTEADKAATFAFHDWLRHNLYENKPYDQWVRELLTQPGNPASTRRRPGTARSSIR